MNFNKVILIAYCLVASMDALSWVLESTALHTFSKPLIMPLLIAAVINDINLRKTFVTVHAILLFAILLYWAGDTVVMINQNISFVAALGLLLLGMIVSIYCFVISSEKFKLKPLLAIPYLAYGTIFYLVLRPYLGDFSSATTVFSLIMVSMPFVAHCRKGHTTARSFSWVLIGSIILLVSNSIAGIDRFGLVSNTFTAVTSISTYAVAHWLMVNGILLHPIKQKEEEALAI